MFGHVCSVPCRSVKQFCQRHVSANKNRHDNSERKMEELERGRIARKGVTPRNERCGIVDRLLTSIHLLTCSNGLRYFYIKLTAVGQVSLGLTSPYNVSRKPKFSMEHSLSSALPRMLFLGSRNI